MELMGFTGDKKEMLDGLKSNSLKLFLSILEGPVDEIIFDKVANALGDFQIVVMRMKQLFEVFVKEELEMPVDNDPNRHDDFLSTV